MSDEADEVDEADEAGARGEAPSYSSAPRSIHVLINPASGQDRPILAPINRYLSKSRIPWDVTVLQQGSEAEAVRRALSHDPELLLVYGGDGTAAQVATTILEVGSPVIMAPLHGGTANALATHLGVPEELEEAVEVLCEGRFTARPTDVGFARGHAFFLRASIGFAARLTLHASREQKDALGVFAYALSTIQAMRETEVSTFTLTIDGVTSSHEAIACIIANADGTGVGQPLASRLDEADARLDALLVPNVAWAARALANAASGAGLLDGAPRRSGAMLRVDSDIKAPVHVDGEYVGETPVDISVRPQAVRLTWCSEPV